MGTTYERSKQTNGSVKSQLEDEDSQLNYYCKLIALRNRYPEIARGDYKALVFDTTTFGGFKITYGEEEIVLLHNTNDKDVEIDLSACKEIDAGKLKVKDFIGQGDAKLTGSTLTLGPQTSVILK